jgi:eukaryotic-like serine/threonine-protein kinase
MASDLESDHTIPMSMPLPGDAIASQSRPASLLAGRYELLGLLGVGGMGAVYRARDLELDEVVALKMLSGDLARAPGMIERFREEVRLARRVTHPNIARIFDIGTTGEDWFLTMELVDGESLAAVLEREGTISLGRAVGILTQVCAGVAAAHRAGIVHRDLKPDNILLRRDGHAVVADFGIARALADHRAAEGEGQISGTPAYMAPEQVLGSSDIDGRADVYALGATLYECLTGRVPFEGESAVRMATARLSEPPPDPRSVVPALPDAIAEIVLKCTARDREQRFASLEALGAGLERVRLAPSSSRVLPPELVRQHTRFDRTVAVLPLSNGSAAADDYLADTLTDDLTELLSAIGGVRVRKLDAAQRRAARRQGVEHDPRALGRAVSAQAVVDGTVSREGDQIHVSLRLIAVADGFQLWTMASVRRPEDFFAFEDEAAAAIANALAASEVPEPRHVDVGGEALDLFLRGRHLFLHAWIGNVPEAADLLRRAHEAAPNDARIAAFYGRSLVRCYSYGDHSAAPLAEDLLESLPKDPEASLGLASLQFQRGEAISGARLLRKCLARAPFLAEAVEWKGRILLEVGPIEAGIAALREAYALEPLLGSVPSDIGRGLALLGDWPGAVEAFLSATVDSDQAPTLWMYAVRCALWYGDRARADEFTARFKALGRPEARIDKIFVGYQDVFARGSAAALDAALEMNNRAPRSEASFAQYRAEAFALTGEVDAALSALAAADGNGLIDESWVELCPAIARIRTAPAFAPIAARVRERAASVRAVLAKR